jgi:hypothetical protein
MVKRFALMFAAAALVTIPASSAFAAPHTNADGLLPDGACLAVYPPAVQPALCGRGTGGPGSAG